MKGEGKGQGLRRGGVSGKVGRRSGELRSRSTISPTRSTRFATDAGFQIQRSPAGVMQATQAVKEDRFHIYRVRTVDEGMEILTGRRAGKRREDGRWEEGTINHLVQERLSQLAENARRFRDFRSGGRASAPPQTNSRQPPPAQGVPAELNRLPSPDRSRYGGRMVGRHPEEHLCHGFVRSTRSPARKGRPHR